MSIEALAEDWKVPVRSVERIVGMLKMPFIRWPETEIRYVNLFALEYGLFELTMPRALQGERKLMREVHQVAALLYGTLTKEVIRDRVRKLAKEMRGGLGRPKKKREA